MKFVKIFIFMIFCHIIDDYCLQGILASMKQKTWWMKQEGYNHLYVDDYKMALFMHSFSWSFMIMFPALWVFGFDFTPLLLFVFIFNILVHMFVDNLKANKLLINLITDQLIHIVQILITTVFILR